MPSLLPSYPQVEAFLRSNQEGMIYSELSCLAEAKSFAGEIEAQAQLNGFSVRVTPKGNRNSARYIISKNLSFFSEQFESIGSFRAN